MGAALTVANATSASAIKAENVFMVYLLASVCSLSVMDQLNSDIRGDPRRTEISFCDRYDSRALSDPLPSGQLKMSWPAPMKRASVVIAFQASRRYSIFICDSSSHESALALSKPAHEIPDIVVSTTEALMKCGIFMVSIALGYAIL